MNLTIMIVIAAVVALAFFALGVFVGVRLMSAAGDLQGEDEREAEGYPRYPVPGGWKESGGQR